MTFPDLEEAIPPQPRLLKLAAEQEELRRALARLQRLSAPTDLVLREREALRRRLATLDRRAYRLTLEAVWTDYGGEGE